MQTVCKYTDTEEPGVLTPSCAHLGPVWACWTLVIHARRSEWAPVLLLHIVFLLFAPELYSYLLFFLFLALFPHVIFAAYISFWLIHK